MFDIPHPMFCSYNNAKQRYLKSRDKTGARIHLASAAEAGGLVSLLRFFYFNLLSFTDEVRMYVFGFISFPIMRLVLSRYVLLLILFGS